MARHDEPAASSGELWPGLESPAVGRLEGPLLALRFQVALKSARLDEQLARGVSPTLTPALALRARTLVERRTRARLARAVAGLLEQAERGPWAAPPVRLPRRNILAARVLLLALVERLRDGRPCTRKERRWSRS